MASSTLNDFSSFIKSQLLTQERISEQLRKATVMLSADLAVGGADLLHKSAVFTQYYFWVVSDLAAEALKLSEESLDSLVRQM